MRQRAILALLGISTALACSRLAAATFDLVGVHPDAAAQPTAIGRTLSTLKPFAGKIYAGYGDYNANTGPINVRAFDPDAGQFTPSLLSVLTEHILVYREIGGKLYTPIIDTSAGGGGGTGFAVGTAEGSWQNLLPVGGIHMFDVGSLDGQKIIMTGAVTGPTYYATAWESPDGVNNWSVSHVEPPPSNYFGRFYGLGNFQGKLWTEARFADLSGGPGRSNTPYSSVYDGTSWSQGPDLLPGGGQTVWRPEAFKDHMVYLTLHSGFQASRLYKFDGTTAGQAYVDPAGAAASLFRDFAITEDYFYGLLSDGRLMQTTDLENWTVFDTTSPAMRSIAVMDGVLYLGSENAELFAYSAAVPETFVLGDMNGDGALNNLDIQPFELALTQTDKYSTLNPAVLDFAARGNANGDEDFNNLDIQPFERLLTAMPPAQPVPEPSTLLSMLLGIASLCVRRKARKLLPCIVRPTAMHRW